MLGVRQLRLTLHGLRDHLGDIEDLDLLLHVLRLHTVGDHDGAERAGDGGYLGAGRQDLVPGKPLVYGQSITDGCIDWQTSIRTLEDLAQAAQARRRLAR